MKEYEQTMPICARADEVFAFLSEVRNLPHYLPPITHAEPEGGERVWLRGRGPDDETFENDGYYSVDEASRRMEWGADTERTYSGWLTVAQAGDDQSEVTVHLEFGPRSVEPEIQERTSEERDPTQEVLQATLESIRKQIEEGSGKIEPPPLDR
jgi:uncharacterized membrane protein